MNLDSQAYDELAELTVASSLGDVTKVIERFDEAFRHGDGDAGFILGHLFSPYNVILSDTVKAAIGTGHEKSTDYFKNAYPMLMQEALAGNGRSMHLIAIYHQSGLPPVSHNLAQYEHWKNKAIEAGYRGAGQL